MGPLSPTNNSIANAPLKRCINNSLDLGETGTERPRLRAPIRSHLRPESRNNRKVMADYAYTLDTREMTVFSEDLAQCIGAAWVIDPTRNRILAANDAGCEVFGWSEASRLPPLVMDAGMPGFVRLRFLLTADDLKKPSIEELLLWTRNGAERLQCRVSRLPGDNRHMFLVEEVKESAAHHKGMNGSAYLEDTGEPDQDLISDESLAKAQTASRAQRRKKTAPKLAVDNEVAKPKAKAKTKPAAKPAQKKKAATRRTKKKAPKETVAQTPAPTSTQRAKTTSAPSHAKQLGAEQTKMLSPQERDAATLQAIAAQIRSGRRKTLPASRDHLIVDLPDPDQPVANQLAQQKTVTAPSAPISAKDVGLDAHLPGVDPTDHSLAKLAHEMKTTLSAISAASEIMRDERFGEIANPRYQSYAADIYNNAQHVLGVIERMLPSKDTESSKEAFAITEIDLNLLCNQVISGLQPIAEDRQLLLSLDANPDLPHIVADATSVRQILINLINNAVKFTPPGGTVAVATSYKMNGPVTLAVKDTGPGMEHAAIQRAMSGLEPHTLAQRDGGGFGLGFPLVHQLATSNGAKLDIKSRLGRGTTITIAFAKDRLVIV